MPKFPIIFTIKKRFILVMYLIGFGIPVFFLSVIYTYFNSNTQKDDFTIFSAYFFLFASIGCILFFLNHLLKNQKKNIIFISDSISINYLVNKNNTMYQVKDINRITCGQLGKKKVLAILLKNKGRIFLNENMRINYPITEVYQYLIEKYQFKSKK